MILAAALLLAGLTTKSFANDVKVTPVVLKSFQTMFAGAGDVQWSKVDYLYKAEFDIDGEKTAAFFSIEDGSLVATTRYLSISDLPRALRSELKKESEKAPLTELFEVQSETGTDYYATLQQDGKPLVLKAAINKWSVYKK